MSEIELLKDYRKRVIALQVVQEQLARCGTTGAPTALRANKLSGMPRGTNDPNAAAVQLADGLEAMARRQQEELNRLWPKVLELTSRIDDSRLYMIIHHYYVLAQTIDQIALNLYLSSRTVSRLKQAYLMTLRGKR